jgi:hypothetical protein
MESKVEHIEIKYQSYIEIYKHYSSLMFNARLSIISVIFLAYGYTLGIISHESQEISDTITKTLTPIAAITLIAAIFLLEVSYYKNFFWTTRTLNQIEGELFGEERFSLFRKYGRNNWHFTIMYLAAGFSFSGTFSYYCFLFYDKLNTFELWFYSVLCAGAMFSLFWVWSQLNKNYFTIILNCKDISTIELIHISFLIIRNKEQLNNYRNKTSIKKRVNK